MTYIVHHAGRKHRLPTDEAFTLWFENTRPSTPFTVASTDTFRLVAALGSPLPASPSVPHGAGCSGGPYTTPEPAA
jgi:hypothetical protein